MSAPGPVPAVRIPGEYDRDQDVDDRQPVWKPYPKIVVVSLDPPFGVIKEGDIRRWDFVSPKHRTTEYVSTTHEKDDYTLAPCESALDHDPGHCEGVVF